MTLRRTIHRRAARKRAKVRAKQPQRSLIRPDWITAEVLRLLAGHCRLPPLGVKVLNA